MQRPEGKKFGLIGKRLRHSFSQQYFRNKFDALPEWESYDYALLELDALTGLRQNIGLLGWAGFNVTIPYKAAILPHLDAISDRARSIGAVNTVKIMPDGRWNGFNTDAGGFVHALGAFRAEQALVLGTGGAAKAIIYGLQSLGMVVHTVSRHSGRADFTYSQLTHSIIKTHPLVVNCTPLGTYPEVESYPDLPYEGVTSGHLFYDLVYNPPRTEFLKKASHFGAQTLNGYPMLVAQAEAAWRIWNEEMEEEPGFF